MPRWNKPQAIIRVSQASECVEDLDVEIEVEMWEYDLEACDANTGNFWSCLLSKLDLEKVSTAAKTFCTHHRNLGIGYHPKAKKVSTNCTSAYGFCILRHQSLENPLPILNLWK